MNSAMDNRMNFEVARAALKKVYPSKDIKQFVLTMSTLIFEQAVVAGQTLYTFPILQTQDQIGQFNTETRLKYQDSFIITKMAYNICNPGSAVATTFIPDTFPNPFVYGANAVAMNSLYNGDIKFTINNEVILYNWDLLQHYYAPETQQTAGAGPGSPLDQKRLVVDSYQNVEPTITLVGTNDNQLTVNLDGPPATFNAFSRLRITVRGINAQNSTVFVQN